jgi:hypothetical protein
MCTEIDVSATVYVSSQGAATGKTLPMNLLRWAAWASSGTSLYRVTLMQKNFGRRFRMR